MNPTVAKSSDRGVLFCAGGETGRVIPRFRRGLRRSGRSWRLSCDIARDPTYSHARPSDAPFLAQTLGCLSVSRLVGYRGVVSAPSVTTYRGWVRGVERSRIEIHAFRLSQLPAREAGGKPFLLSLRPPQSVCRDADSCADHSGNSTSTVFSSPSARRLIILVRSPS